MTFVEDSLAINASEICIPIMVVQLLETDPMTKVLFVIINIYLKNGH